MHIVDANFPFRAEAITDPILVQCANRIGFVFLATDERIYGNLHDAGVVVFRSSTVIQIRYGHPNDEAYPGRPLYDKGLSEIGIAEVEGSDWLRDVIKINMRVFPNSETIFNDVRHHVFPFKETTLEVLWREFEFEVVQATCDEIALDLIRWVNE